MGQGILKAQLRDFDEIGERANREIQMRQREKYNLNTGSGQGNVI
jgi:hypothetical protein